MLSMVVRHPLHRLVTATGIAPDKKRIGLYQLMFNKVLLPLPDGQTKLTKAPAAMLKLAWRMPAAS
jgi:hypothetical protein